MRFINAKHPAIAYALIPWFVPVNESREEMFLKLRDRLENEPEDTFCLVAEEDTLCQGILIAYPENDYIWIWQAHSRKGRAETKDVWDMLISWAKEKGYNKLKCGPKDQRIKKIFCRRYKFVDNGDVMERQI